MAFAETLHSGDGGTKTFAVGFTYLLESYVQVFVDTVEQTRPAEWDFDGGGTNVVFVTAPPSGTDNIIITRTTDLNTRLVDFVDGANMTEEDLDTSAQQLFDILQEQDDEDQLKLGRDGANWDAEARRITNMADPVDAQDAATFGAIQTSETNAAASAAAASAAQTAAEAAQTAAEAAQAAAEAAAAVNAAVIGKGHLAGLGINKVSTTVTVGPGGPWPYVNLVDALFAKDITSEWVAGDGNGGLANGISLTGNTAYYIHLLMDSADLSDGNFDVGFDTDIDGTNLLADADVITAGWDTARVINMCISDSGGTTVRDFNQIDNEVRLAAPIDITSSIFSGANIPTTGVTGSLAPLPTNRVNRAILSIGIRITGTSGRHGGSVMFGHPDAVAASTMGDVTSGPSISPRLGQNILAVTPDPVGADPVGGGEVVVMTNGTGQISAKASVLSTDYEIALVGWMTNFRSPRF